MATVYRFSPHPSGWRSGRIALSIDGRQARRQYWQRRLNGDDQSEARGWVIHVFCKAVDE